MERAVQSAAELSSRGAPANDKSGLFSTQSPPNLQKLIFAGSPLSDVLATIAQFVESQAEGMSCTIWLPDGDGKELYCAAAPSLPAFSAPRGDHVCWSKRRILRHSGLSEGVGVCDRHPDRSLPGTSIVTACCLMEFVSFGPAHCSPAKGKPSALFRSIIVNHATPAANDLQLIENASHITGIAIERHMKEQALQHERDRLRLLLEITSSPPPPDWTSGKWSRRYRRIYSG